MQAKRILVCGYYGFANTGDEAILTVLLRDLRAAHPGAEIVVMAGSPEAVMADHGVGSFHWQDVARLVAEAGRSDLMVLGGGGLFQDYHGFEPEEILTSRHGAIGYYAGFALLAGMTSTPLIIYGVGVGPLTTEIGRRYTRLAFGQASVATVRDDASLALLGEIGVDTSRVRVTADPAWALEPSASIPTDQMPSRSGFSTIGVAVRPWDAGEWIGALAAALDRLVDQCNVRILFVVFQDSPRAHENDAQAALEVGRRMHRTDRWAIVRGAYTPAERMAILGSCDLVIAMRLHSVIFAAKTRVPVVALSYDAKVRVAMEQLGVDGQAMDLSTLTADGLVAAAERAVVPADEVIAGLRTLAATNRLALDQAPPPSPPGEETVRAYVQLALGRTRDLSRLESEILMLRRRYRALEHERQVLEQEHGMLTERCGQVEQQLTQLIMSRSWILTRPLRVLGRLARAPRSAGLDLARRAYNRLPDGPLKLASRRIASGVLGWQQGQGLSEPITRTIARRRLEAWAEFDESVLSRRGDYKGVFIQSLGIPWDVPLYQRPQHMASALGRLGYLVIYRTRSDYESRDMSGVEEIAENVWLTGCDEVSTIRGAITSYYSTGFWHSVEDYIASREQGAVVYEYIDHIAPAISGTENIRKLRELRDFAFTGGVDCVVASARVLEEEARNAIGPEKVIYIPNGVDCAHYSVVRPPSAKASHPRALQGFHKAYPRIVGYFGALAPWLWYRMLSELVALRPDLGFVFIGPDYLNASSSLPRADNVLWAGPVDYKMLPAIASVFDVTIIPFEPGDIAQTTSPLKLYEYFALGKPVVVTADMKECVTHNEVLSANSAREYSAKIDRAMRQAADPDFADRMRDLARQNDWMSRAKDMATLFSRLQP